MISNPTHKYMNIWREGGEYVDYCPCCGEVRIVHMGRNLYYHRQEPLPIIMNESLKARLDILRGALND